MVERSVTRASASYVYVASKIANGLTLYLHEMVDAAEASPTGTRTVKLAQRIEGKEVVLRPARFRIGTEIETPLPGGYSVTRVPADFWEAWEQQNKDSDLLKSKTIFMEDTYEKASQRARRQRDDKKIRSGLEPLDPKALPKIGLKGMTIQTYDPEPAS